MDNLKSKIKKYGKIIWKPTNLKYKNVKSNSWYDMKIGTNKKKS